MASNIKTPDSKRPEANGEDDHRIRTVGSVTSDIETQHFFTIFLTSEGNYQTR